MTFTVDDVTFTSQDLPDDSATDPYELITETVRGGQQHEPGVLIDRRGCQNGISADQ